MTGTETRRHRKLVCITRAGTGAGLLIGIVAVLGVLAGSLHVAHAQQPGQAQPVPMQPGQPMPGQAQPVPMQPGQPMPGQAQVRPGHGQVSQQLSDSPRALSRSKSTAVVFWVFALMMVAGSIFVITRRNLITAVMGMVGTFFAIAAVYAMLYAGFLTVIQVLVYAGAIMVLFVFVIMIMNKPEAEPWSTTNLPGKIVISGLLLYLLVRLVMVLWSIEPGLETFQAPRPVDIISALGSRDAPFGSTRALGWTLFRDYLFPFEAVSLVLLIAVVGAIAVARPHERTPLPEDLDSQEAALGSGKAAPHS